MPADLIDALDAELQELADETAELPHAPACQGGAGCWCPIHDVLDLLQDRRDTLADRVREA